MFKQKTQGQSERSSFLTIGTKLEGRLYSQGDIRIEGCIQGDIECQGKLIIGTIGVIEGQVTGSFIDCSGSISGNVDSANELLLRKSCRLEGAIMAGKLEVERGAVINGRCTVGSRD